MTAAARKLDPDGGRRRRELAFIHIGKAQLAMTDDTYRALIARFSGGRTESSADLDQAERGRVIEHLKTFGAGRPRLKGRGADEREQASKLRALWRSLYQLGAVRDASDAALAAFVKRQTGIEALRWNRAADLAAGIEALKSWCGRIGYTPRRSDIPGPCRGRYEPALIEAQWARLGAAGAFKHPADANLGAFLRDHFAVTGDPRLLSLDDAQDAVRRLGAWLRRVAKDSAP